MIITASFAKGYPQESSSAPYWARSILIDGRWLTELCKGPHGVGDFLGVAFAGALSHGGCQGFQKRFACIVLQGGKSPYLGRKTV